MHNSWPLTLDLTTRDTSLLFPPHQAAITALNSLQTNAKELALQRKTGGRDLAKSLADVKTYAQRLELTVSYSAEERNPQETLKLEEHTYCRSAL